MNPHNPDATILELLIMAREWIKRKAQEHQEKQEALLRARIAAEKEAVVMTDLSRNDFNMVLKVFKSTWTGCETSEWYIRFKQSFEQMHEQKQQVQRRERQEEEDRAN